MNKISDWAMPKLEEYKRLADSRWRMSETTYYISNIRYNKTGIGKLCIELGPREREDVSGSWYWHSVGIVAPLPGEQVFEYMVKYRNEVYVHINGWDDLISTLESDLKEYNQKMLRALRKNLELEIDSLPG